MSNHRWIRAPRRRLRDAAIDALELPPILARLDAHGRLRGPYTAAGALLRAIVGDALGRCPALGARHNIEILTCAPELAGQVPPTWTTLEWTVGDGERTRFYSRLHTLNIANGLAELLRDYLRAAGTGPCTLVVDNVHEADPTDMEFVAVLLRRTDLEDLTVVVGTGVEPVADPPGEIAISLVQTLRDRTTIVERLSAPTPTGQGSPQSTAPPSIGDELALARAFVDSDGTTDEPEAIAAYRRRSPDERVAMHDERAAALRALGEPSLLLGAVAYHAENGSDPVGAGLDALAHAMEQCRGVGLYQAAADLGRRGRAIVDRATQPDRWWQFTDATAICLASLGRADEAQTVLDEARAATHDPLVHMELAYSMAMLYARHYPEPRRDYRLARAWMNVSIAIASLIDDPKRRAFHSVFGGNGLALVEVRENRPEEALRLLEAGIARLDRELEHDEHALHRLVLRYNRAQVLGAMGRLEEALDDYAVVVAADPDFPEHHFNVGTILRRLGRCEEAIAAFERALATSPPFPEAYYNRADARAEIGDVDGALADFAYTIQLDPDRIDAHVNRAELLFDRDETDAAWEAVTAGLALAPASPQLLCVKARLLADAGRTDEARQAVTEALSANDGLAEVWAVRAELAYDDGDLVSAVGDFDRAVELSDGPWIRFNRAVVHQEAERYEAAVADYEAVLTATADADARERLQVCRAALGS